MTDDAEGVDVSIAPTDSAEQSFAPHRRRSLPVLTAVIAVVVVVLDQLTKRWAVSQLTGEAPRHIVWTLQFNLARNRGMAFSQGQGIGPLIAIAALLIVLWLAWSARKVSSAVPAVAAGLVAGGALGNLADRVFRGDRVLHGEVIDFIDFQWFPIFNVADMAIDIGGVLFVGWTLLSHRSLKAKGRTA